MRTSASICAAVLIVSTAGAGIDLFLTKAPSPPGMKEPDTLNPNEKNFLSSYDKWAGLPDRSPFIQEPNTPTIYFVWAEITRPLDIPFIKIYGIDLRESKAKGSAYVDDGFFYRHNKPAPGAYKRWDSTGKLALPGLAGAVTARGIECPANPSDITNDVDRSTYTLLGVIYLTGPGPGRFQLGLGSWTMAVRTTDNKGNTRDYTGEPGNRYPELTIQGHNAYEGPYVAVEIPGTPDRHGDMNCDGAVDFGDIHPFVLAITYPLEYMKRFPDCDIMNGDCNGDGSVDFGDINPFVALLSGN